MDTVWNPISTAPRDGTLMFLDYGDGVLSIGAWIDARDEFDGCWHRACTLRPIEWPSTRPRVTLSMIALGSETPIQWQALPLPPLLPDQEEEAAA